MLGGGSASADPLGIMLAVASGTGYATYTVLAKRMLRRGHAPERVMAAVVLARRRCCSCRCWLLGDLAGSPPADGLAMALFLGAVPTALAYVLFARGLRAPHAGRDRDAHARRAADRDRPRRLALGERPGAVAATGAALVLAGLLALALPARARPRRAGPAPHDRTAALARVSTVDALAAALRTRILDGELAPGERLRELELAEAYGVARHSLRAALRALAAEGLVTIEPNRGARVARLAPRRHRARCSSSAPRSSSRPPGSRWSATAAGCPSRSTTRSA